MAYFGRLFACAEGFSAASNVRPHRQLRYPKIREVSSTDSKLYNHDVRVMSLYIGKGRKLRSRQQFEPKKIM